MQQVSVYRYFFLGTAFRYLQDARPNHAIHGDGFVIQNIDSVLEAFDELGLAVTRKAASHGLEELRKELASRPADANLTADDAGRLRQVTSGLRDTLDAEADLKAVFIVTEKRHDVDKLLRGVQRLLAPGVYNSLSPIAQHDFAEAGRCIAFECPTAAAFHLLRGTEETLRRFYLAVVRRNRIKPPLMWAAMVTDMRSRKKAPPTELLDNLDNIRKSFRNPTQHPERNYDIHEAQDLFGLCVDVVNRMAAVVAKWRKK